MISAASETPGSEAAGEAWFTRRKLFLLLGVFVLMAFPTVILGTSSFFYRDMGLFGYPLAQFHRAAFWQGELPLWNPLNNLGLPFFAQWNTLVLYPGSLIYLLLPLPWSMNFFMLAHLFLAAAGMYALARRWTNHSLAASVAAFVFAWNGLTLHTLMWPNNIAALGWMPWVVLVLERAWREGGRRVCWAALIGAMQMLTGAPEIILLTWLIVGVWWLRDMLGGAGGGPMEGTRGRRWLRFGICGGLVFALCAVQLLPFLDLLRHSNRDASFGGADWSMPLWGWANFLVPMFGCTPSVAGVYSQDAQQWTSTYYLGLGPVVFALLAWRSGDARVKWLLGILLAGLILALGEGAGVYAVLKKIIPVLGFIRFPIKYVVLVVFALPLLAAFGIKAWMETSDAKLAATRLVKTGAFVLLVTVGLMLWAWLQPVGGADAGSVIKNGLFRVAALIGIILGLLLARRSWSPKWAKLTPHWLLVGVLLILGLDMLYHLPPPNPVVPNLGYGPVKHVMSRVPQAGAGRVMISPPMEEALAGLAHPDPLTMFQGHRRMLLANCNLIDGVPKVNGFYSLYLRGTHAVTQRLHRSTNYTLPLLDFLGVEQISDHAELFKWHPRATALPLVTAGQTPVFVTSPESLAAIFAPTFSPRTTVYLPTEAAAVARDVRAGTCRILATQFHRETVAAEVEAGTPSLVVFAQASAPGWRATLDGQPVPLLQANHAFQAVVVPAGTHRVELRYEDRYLRLGAIVSGVSLLACLAGLFWRRPSF